MSDSSLRLLSPKASIITIYACIAEDFETVKQIYYENCLKSRELHQCKDRQFYTMILKRTLPIPRFTQI